MENRGFDSEWLQKLRDANDLVTIASKYCYIKRQGRKFWTCCPFHHEKTPSFCINPDEQFYHCFGCNESGDVISFIMKIESLDFLDAVKFLADRSGLKVPEFKGEKEIFEKKKKKERMLLLLKDANEFYKCQLYLPLAKEAQDYVKQRQLTKKELDKFEIGYSPNYDALIKHLQNKGYTEDEMLEIGMASKDDNGKLLDFFAYRLMFPLFNKFGDCVGFSGRDIRGKSKAKYKNSIQSIVFDKSSTVFALNHIKNLKQTEIIDHVIICEGQMDVISMHKAGFNTAVACLGTALTEQHAKEIKRVTDNVIICLDGDSAGVQATIKAIPILNAQGLEVRVAMLKGGKDPDEIIKNNGIDFMKDLIANAIDSIEYQIISIGNKYDVKDGVGRTKFLNEVFDVLKGIPTKSGREFYIPLISQISKVPQNVIREDVSSFKIVPFSANIENEKPSKVNADGLMQSQIFILASLLNNCEYAIVDENTNLCLKNSDLVKLFDYILQKKNANEKINKVCVYDMFGESNATINECMNYNFEAYKKEALAEHYIFCLKFIKSKLVEQEIDEIRERIKTSNNEEDKRKLVLILAEKIKEKQKLKLGEVDGKE